MKLFQYFFYFLFFNGCTIVVIYKLHFNLSVHPLEKTNKKKSIKELKTRL